MTTRNNRIRFGENNFAKLISASIVYSSELSAFPFTNALNPFRSRVWKPSGNFTIDSTNKNIYINDGSNKTAVLTEADYSTPALMATEIQTQLNAVSANWTCTYDSAGETYRFTIGNSGSVTLRLSQTTNAAWDTIGYTTSVDLVGTSFVADQQRNHTDERVTMDLGYNAEITFFALIGALDEVFTVSNDATITLMGSNLDSWTSPPFSIAITPTDKGAMRFLDDQTDTSYRYWRVQIIDKQNPLGPEGISIGVLYLGDYVTLVNRNVGNTFSKTDVDPSDTQESVSGVLHFDTKTKYTSIDGATINVLDRADKETLRLMYEVLGNTTPFFISLDPTLCVSDDIDELTKYVVFRTEPTFTHIISDIYTMSLDVREVI